MLRQLLSNLLHFLTLGLYVQTKQELLEALESQIRGKKAQTIAVQEQKREEYERKSVGILFHRWAVWLWMESMSMIERCWMWYVQVSTDNVVDVLNALDWISHFRCRYQENWGELWGESQEGDGCASFSRTLLWKENHTVVRALITDAGKLDLTLNSSPFTLNMFSIGSRNCLQYFTKTFLQHRTQMTIFYVITFKCSRHSIHRTNWDVCLSAVCLSGLQQPPETHFSCCLKASDTANVISGKYFL